MEKLRFVTDLSDYYNVSAVVDGHFPFFAIRDDFTRHVANNGSQDFSVQLSIDRPSLPVISAKRTHNGRNLPYLQMMRDPTSRTISQFYYMKYESEDALRRKRKNNEMTSEAGKGILTLGDECADNQQCRGWLKRRCQAQLTYISGDNDGNMLDNALKQVTDPQSSHYVAIGLTEYFEQSLEMFECVAPMTFRGASANYHAQPLHKKQGMAHAAAVVSERTARLLEEYCSEENTLYEEANRTFWARYNAIKETPELCCRANFRAL
jgi:hypothetical protein